MSNIMTRTVLRTVTFKDNLIYIPLGATVKELTDFLMDIPILHADVFKFHRFEKGEPSGVRLIFSDMEI